MLRGFRSIIPLLSAAFIASHWLGALVDEIRVHAEEDANKAAQGALHTQQEQQQQQQQQQQQHNHELQLHPPLLVDTKYWIKDTEFGERDNWRDKSKPCSLRERIRLNEQAVVSLGNSMDPLGATLESNIKELLLPMNGMLLMEEDSLVEPTDSMFIQYLSESGDCFDSTAIQHDHLAQQSAGHQVAAGDYGTLTGHLFVFQPDSDQMSWFNPDNWISSLSGEINDWIPDSHRIPCSEEIVAFGSRSAALSLTIDSNEPARTLSFKVNFEASSHLINKGESNSKTDASGSSDIRVNQLRVAKLKIGDTIYNQREFERLINSDEYENILFEFNSSRSVLKAEEGFDNRASSLLVIDESSVLTHREYNLDFCADEAGCLCGNEETNIMRAICSFVEPLKDHEQPCHDPIYSTGYCSKICATVITLTMDPNKFKEQYIVSLLNKMLSSGEHSNLFDDSVFTGGRRTYDNKYEITFRHAPSPDYSYDSTIGKEMEFAKLVHRELDNVATRSFYGIKTINLRSSTSWRRNNQMMISMMAWPLFFMLSMLIFAYQVGFNSRIDAGADPSRGLISLRNWFIVTTRRIHSRGIGAGDEGNSFVELSEPSLSHITEQVYNSASGIPLVELEYSNDLTISTANLVEE